MIRSFRLNGRLVWLCLASGALALPLSAEEITVTIPPDPPAQAATVQAPPPAPLPSFSAGGLQTSEATDTTAASPAVPAAPPAKARPAPVAQPPAASDSAAAAPAAPAAPAKPAAAPATKDAAKTKHAAAKKPSVCKGLDEAACGGNKACKWTVPAANAKPDASGQVATPHCGAVASVKKKAATKAAKAPAPEVLPWAPKETPATAEGASAEHPAATAATKPATAKKVKTATAKKTPKPKTEVAPPVPTASDGAQEAPASAAPAPEQDPQ